MKRKFQGLNILLAEQILHHGEMTSSPFWSYELCPCGSFQHYSLIITKDGDVASAKPLNIIQDCDKIKYFWEEKMEGIHLVLGFTSLHDPEPFIQVSLSTISFLSAGDERWPL